MNIQVQFCGLFILLLLFIFYKSHRTLQLFREKVFFVVLCIMITSLSLDILSIVAIYYSDFLPHTLVETTCRLYLSSLIWVAYSPVMYVLADVFSETKYRNKITLITLLVLLQSIIPFLFKLNIYNDGKQIYTYGPTVISVYVFASINLIATVILVIAFRKKINSRSRFAVMIWMSIWIICALIQFLDNSLLIVGFASAIGVLILFTIIENPEANIDRRLGCFNSYAFAEYTKQLFENNVDFSFLDISFVDSTMLEKNDFDSNDVIYKILQEIKSDKDIYAFKNITYGLVLVSVDTDKLRIYSKILWEELSDINDFEKQTRFILATNTSPFSNMDELFHFLSYVRDEYAYEKGLYFEADETVVDKYLEQYLIQQEIAAALLEDRVEVFLQPIYSKDSECFTSAEALVRIRKADGILLSPGVFIPVAEESGQILELGERVMEKVCHFLKNTDAREKGIHYIEVNLSVIQCEKKDLAERMISIVEKYQVDPACINLEITETASISARATLLENMKRLIDYGFSFALDDFGKGESNLMYVVEMPVSIVKLDYDMTKAFFATEKAIHVVRAVIGMAHQMGLKLVAEGIELADENERLQAEGIDYIQGYYYSKPLPMEEFLEFVN